MATRKPATAKVRAKLERAKSDLARVRISRPIDRHTVEGFVVAIGLRWAMLATLADTIDLDGHVVIRIKDITKVERRSDFAAQVLRKRNQWPPAPVALDLDSRRELLRMVSLHSHLIAIHLEADDPDVCFIGRPLGFDGRRLVLQEINPRGVWHDRPTYWRTSGITRVDFGGRYEQALIEVGGEWTERAD